MARMYSAIHLIATVLRICDRHFDNGGPVELYMNFI
jgi:hypothetical protein